MDPYGDGQTESSMLRFTKNPYHMWHHVARTRRSWTPQSFMGSGQATHLVALLSNKLGLPRFGHCWVHGRMQRRNKVPLWTVRDVFKSSVTLTHRRVFPRARRRWQGGGVAATFHSTQPLLEVSQPELHNRAFRRAEQVQEKRTNLNKWKEPGW